mgnify:CR=1 FL=1
MNRWSGVVLVLTPLVFGVPSPATAQTVAGASSPFSGSVPNGSPTADPLRLTLAAALERGLTYNLGIISLEEQVESAKGSRIRSLRALMPRVDARVNDSRQTTNLAAFGFNADALGIPGISFPSVVGPFNVFDARVYASQPLFDRAASNDIRSSTFAVNAAQLDARNAREPGAGPCRDAGGDPGARDPRPP